MLINCAVYQDGLRIADLQLDQIAAYPVPPGAFAWVALKDASADALRELQRVFGLHDLAVEDASVGHERPKVEEYGDCVFTVVHLVEAAGSELHLAELDIFSAPTYVISIRNRSQQDFLGVRARCERDSQLLQMGPAFVLYALIDAVVDRYFPIAAACSFLYSRFRKAGWI